jgi:hypothetical protein
MVLEDELHRRDSCRTRKGCALGRSWSGSAPKNRDFIASRMTPALIAEAQKLVREWKPKKEK